MTTTNFFGEIQQQQQQQHFRNQIHPKQFPKTSFEPISASQ
jgi:hypothetical protein